MKPFPLALSFMICLGGSLAMGKPPVASKPTLSPAVAPAFVAVPGSPANPWLRWLLEQDGGTSAVNIPWPELIQATAGRQTTPFKPSDPVDVSIASRIAAAMDSVLPRLNRPDGPIRSAKRIRLIPPLVEDEVQAAFAGVAGLSCEEAAENVPAVLGQGDLGAYPAFRLIDQATHRVYYLGVTFCPIDQRESASPLLHVAPKAAVARITSDGACLLIVLEHNNKSGAELAFLNWELVDLGQGKVRVQTAFEAMAGELLLPSTVIMDGRRGRD